MWKAIIKLAKRNQTISNRTANNCGDQVTAGIHLIHTSMESTALLLRAAEGFTSNSSDTIHIHAALPIPYHLELDNPLVSVQYTERMIGECVRQFGSPVRTYAIRVYECRSRAEGLLQRLPHDSLILLAARWRPWPTLESRLGRALVAAGHRLFTIPRTHRQQIQPGALPFPHREQQQGCGQNTPAQPTR